MSVRASVRAWRLSTACSWRRECARVCARLAPVDCMQLGDMQLADVHAVNVLCSTRSQRFSRSWERASCWGLAARGSVPCSCKRGSCMLHRPRPSVVYRDGVQPDFWWRSVRRRQLQPMLRQLQPRLRGSQPLRRQSGERLRKTNSTATSSRRGGRIWRVTSRLQQTRSLLHFFTARAVATASKAHFIRQARWRCCARCRAVCFSCWLPW